MRYRTVLIPLVWIGLEGLLATAMLLVVSHEVTLLNQPYDLAVLGGLALILVTLTTWLLLSVKVAIVCKSWLKPTPTNKKEKRR